MNESRYNPNTIETERVTGTESRYMTPKQKASKAMSRFIRLRDALAYCHRRGIDLHQFARPEDVIGKCCSCGAVKS